MAPDFVTRKPQAFERAENLRTWVVQRMSLRRRTVALCLVTLEFNSARVSTWLK